MRRLLDVLCAVCSVSAAIVIYMTVIKATEGPDGILPWVIASVFASALTSSLFCLSHLSSRLDGIENKVNYMYDAPEEEEERGEVLPDEDASPYRPDGSCEVFETEDPDYKGTDFSNEEPVSAKSDD